jgi:hypothetical protein
MVVSAILCTKLGGASQELRDVSTNMPFRVATSPTFLYVARKSIVAVFTESTALGLTLLACYQYVQMSHSSLPLIMRRCAVVPTILILHIFCPNPCPTT